MASTRLLGNGPRRNACVVMVFFAIGVAPVVAFHHVSQPADGAVAKPAAVPKPRLVMRGPVDIGFAQDMSLHHEQALTMARFALTRGSPRVRMLAQGIVNQQLKEIGYMQGWLMLWEAPASADTGDMVWMRDAYARAGRRVPTYEQFIESCDEGQGMPGLASASELEMLEAASLPEKFDPLFLALMVRHHQGALVMASFVSEHADLALVRGFARSMAAEQQQEVLQMLKLLKFG